MRYFVIVVLCYASLGAMADADKLVGAPKGKRVIPSLSMSFDIALALWALWLLISGMPW
jgi:hypothetical protein